VGDNESRIVSVKSGEVLDVNGGSSADGAQLIQWPYHGGPNQRWRLGVVGSG
jgi:alpha-L-fucosidase